MWQGVCGRRTRTAQPSRLDHGGLRRLLGERPTSNHDGSPPPKPSDGRVHRCDAEPSPTGGAGGALVPPVPSPSPRNWVPVPWVGGPPSPSDGRNVHQKVENSGADDVVQTGHLRRGSPATESLHDLVIRVGQEVPQGRCSSGRNGRSLCHAGIERESQRKDAKSHTMRCGHGPDEPCATSRAGSRTASQRGPQRRSGGRGHRTLAAPSSTCRRQGTRRPANRV